MQAVIFAHSGLDDRDMPDLEFHTAVAREAFYGLPPSLAEGRETFVYRPFADATEQPRHGASAQHEPDCGPGD